METTTFDFVRTLEAAGFEPKQASVLVEIMEGILGTPLTKDMFEAYMGARDEKSEACMAARDEKIEARMDARDEKIAANRNASDFRADAVKNLIASKLTEFTTVLTSSQELIDQRISSLEDRQKEAVEVAKLREEAFESRIKALISNGRLWMLGGVLTAVFTIIGVSARVLIWGPF